MNKGLQDHIQFIQSNNFKAEYTNYDKKKELSKTALFDAENFIPKTKELLKQRKHFNKERQEELKGRSGKMSQKIETTTLSVNIGFILERYYSTLKDFRFDKNDCRSTFGTFTFTAYAKLILKVKVKEPIIHTTTHIMLGR